MRLTALVLLLCLLPAVHALVAIEGFVTDEADLFTADEEAAITDQLVAMFASGRIEYAVVTVESLEGLAIEDYAYRVAEGNLGDTEQDNGLLLLIAPNERQYRFEVGKGLEGTLNDAKIGRVGRTYLVPAFQEEAYAEGVLAASIAIDDLTRGIEPEGIAAASPEAWPTTEWKLVLIILFIMALVMMFAALKTQQSNRRYGNAAEVAAWMFRGGGGGSGGFGGGGFGGGSFGGGGASGRW